MDKPLAAVNPEDRKYGKYAVGVLAGLALLMFIDPLLAGKRLMVSYAGHDIWSYFYWAREWGFRQLAAGHLPLWNPHIECGVPFFGNFQSALLYPPNWIFLFLPTVVAMNWSVALHVFLAGLFTYIWCHRRGMSRVASLLAGVIFMFCGAYFYKILAGHPTFICSAPWAPVVFLCIDELFKSGRLRWALLGGAAAAMQLLAGSPQFFFNTALAGGLYALLNLVRYREHAWQVVVGLAGMYVLAGALCAVQLLTGAQLAEESIRSEGMSLAGAAVGPMEPGGFLTLLSPFVLSDRNGSIVEGGIRRTMLNVSVAGLVLAVYGMVRGSRPLRRFSFTMVVVLCVLALGRYTPLFRVLYDHLPGFNNFRGTARFAILASLFLAMLAGIGYDRLREPSSRPRLLAIVSAALGVALIAFAVAIFVTRGSPRGGIWGAMLRAVDSTGDIYSRGMANLSNAGRWHRSQAAVTVAAMTVSGLLLGVLALMLGMLRRRPAMLYGIAALVAVELFCTALVSRATMKMPLPFAQPWQEAIAKLGPEERTYQARWGLPDRAMAFGTYEASGYEAGVFSRYATVRRWLATASDSSDREAATAIAEHPAICQMLRIKYILAGNPNRAETAPRPPLRHVQLVDEFAKLPPQKAIVTRLHDETFDPAKTVILEADPAIVPEKGGAAGTAAVVAQGTDWMEITAEAPKNAILLITDTYSKHWHATALAGSSQQKYEIMPGDYLLRAIPLAAGTHRLRLEYRLSGFVAGAWISLAAVAFYAVAGGVWLIGRWRAPCAPPATPPGAAPSAPCHP